VQPLLILLQCVIAAVAYGIAHDQITARVCVEYFTIGHPPVFATEDPTLLAFGWGTIASWWVGLLLGIPLVLVARVGSRPQLESRELWKPIGIFLYMVAFTALIAGIIGYMLANAGLVSLVGPLATSVPQAKHAAFLADAFAHTSAYASGFLGGLLVLAWAWRERHRRSTSSSALL
jgi:hypothetical protein